MPEGEGQDCADSRAIQFTLVVRIGPNEENKLYLSVIDCGHCSSARRETVLRRQIEPDADEVIGGGRDAPEDEDSARRAPGVA
jgi:hypothetical protein